MPVHEIAVRQVKPGRDQAFRQRRADFIRTLTRQAGVGTDREFESFLALPEPDERPVFIGMTTYDSLKANAALQRRPSIIWRFVRFAQTMDLKAYVYVEPTEGPDFDLASLATGPGQVLEVAVRRVKPGRRAEFDARRKDAVALLGAQPGVGDSWEFEVVKGRNTDGLTVGMTVYDSAEVLNQVMADVMADPVMTDYLDTFEPVALQYATSTTSAL